MNYRIGRTNGREMVANAKYMYVNEKNVQVKVPLHVYLTLDEVCLHETSNLCRKFCKQRAPKGFLF